MSLIPWMPFFLLLLFYPCAFAGTKEEERPDREMLRLMELFQEWEVIKDLELLSRLKEMQQMKETGPAPAPEKKLRGAK